MEKIKSTSCRQTFYFPTLLCLASHSHSPLRGSAAHYSAWTSPEKSLTSLLFFLLLLLLSLQVFIYFLSAGGKGKEHRRYLRVAHTAELGSALHDRKLGFHNPLSSETFQTSPLRPPLSFPADALTLRLSPARSVPVPRAAPALSAGARALAWLPCQSVF